MYSFTLKRGDWRVRGDLATNVESAFIFVCERLEGGIVCRFFTGAPRSRFQEKRWPGGMQVFIFAFTSLPFRGFLSLFPLQRICIETKILRVTLQKSK